jgi:LytS/YehU family sensor histidine kinase
MTARQRAYWLCQLVGWSLYAGVNIAVFIPAFPARRAVVGAVLATSAMGAIYTHLLRRLIRRRGWLRLGFLALFPRVMAASMALSVILTASGLMVAWVLFPVASHQGPSVTGTLVYLFNYSVLFFSWQLIYFGVHAFERSRHLELEQWQLKAAAQGAELRYLKAQINPHFLFNCLNSLRALISEDPTRAQAMVSRLASLLRYALGTAHDQLVTLDRELGVVQDYLALEGARFEHRLRSRCEATPESRGVLVPPMLVQMLVENGIKHGIAHLVEGGEVVVSAQVAAGELEVVVTNSAGGVASPPAEGEGIGLANARDRLQLLYGERAALSLDRSAPGHTTATVRLPVT